MIKLLPWNNSVLYHCQIIRYLKEQEIKTTDKTCTIETKKSFERVYLAAGDYAVLIYNADVKLRSSCHR